MKTLRKHVEYYRKSMLIMLSQPASWPASQLAQEGLGPQPDKVPEKKRNPEKHMFHDKNTHMWAFSFKTWRKPTCVNYFWSKSHENMQVFLLFRSWKLIYTYVYLRNLLFLDFFFSGTLSGWGPRHSREVGLQWTDRPAVQASILSDNCNIVRIMRIYKHSERKTGRTLSTNTCNTPY